MSGLHKLRGKLVERCSHRKATFAYGVEAHSVSFQPSSVRYNQDRLVMQQMNIRGQTWLLLGVCDGQGGASTARYIASHLPSRICATLDRVLSSVLYGRTDRQSMLRKSGLISLELRRCIEELDNELGHVVQTVCPDPAHLSEAEADKIVAEYGDVLWRACAGTTLAAALVCLDHKLMWTFNVGNSTVALSTVDANGKRTAFEPCTRHTLSSAAERRRVRRTHPGERDVVHHGRLLNHLTMSRSIGHCALKLDSAYSTRLFSRLKAFGIRPLRDSVIERIRSPPYVTAAPSMRFVDLKPMWEQHPVIMIYSDGVDNLVHECTYLHPGRASNMVPSRTVAILLQDEVDSSVPALLGHDVDLRWSGDLGNRAVDVLGNLIGCTSTRILRTVMDQQLLADRKASPRLYIDDTTMILGILRPDSA